MKFTFGICTAGDIDVTELISNIVSLQVPEYEILIIGGNVNTDIVYQGKIIGRHISFDETVKPAWITRKKNMLAQEAKYENLVLLHDYYRFVPGWYTGWNTFGNEFDVAVNIVQNPDGSRFADWLLNPELYDRTFGFKSHKWLIPYNISCPKIQYISGGYFLVKKDFLLQHPLDENRVWNECEDTEWCERIANHTTMKMNTNSIVKVTKPKWRMCDADMNDVYEFAAAVGAEVTFV